jgi:hypothetical protein
MVAWNQAVLLNTAAGYRAFLVKYPDSDLTATARKLEERLRNRPDFAPPVVAAAGSASVPQNVALAGPTCPCNTQPSPAIKKVDVQPVKRVDPVPPKRADRKPPRRARPEPVDDVIVVRRAPPRVVYEPAPPPPVGVGIGIGIGGGGYRGGNYGGGGYGRGGGY